MRNLLQDKTNGRQVCCFMLEVFFPTKMTPSREDQPPQPLRDKDNYNITDIRSDEDTDDEDHPRKVVPGWASGTEFRVLMLRQAFLPPDLDDIFSEVGHIGRIGFCYSLFSSINDILFQS